MVILTIELSQMRLEDGADAGEDAAQVVQYIFGENVAPILGHKDQVNMY